MREMIEELLDIGSSIVMTWRDRALTVEHKGQAQGIVTQADLDSEQAILAHLDARFPDDGVISEEAGRRPGTSGRTWIVDPLDGTVNFTSGSPNFGVIIGLLEDSVVVAGGMALPALELTYLAEVGGGATRNGEPVMGSRCTTLGEAVLDHSMLWRDDAYNAAEAATRKALLPHVRALRCDHSVRYLADVADGVLDGFVYHSLGLWDIAGPSLILSEAGIVTTSPDGSPLDLSPGLWEPGRRYTTVGANPELHAAIVGCLSS